MTTLKPPKIPAGFLARWCDTLAESSESPPGAFLPTGLALLSAIVGPRLVMRWGVAHEERMNLWVLNVGMSALARKTSGLSGLRSAVGWARAESGDLLRTVSVARISDAGLVASLDVVGEETAKARAEEANLTPKGQEPREIDEVVRPVPLSWLAIFNEVSPVWMEDGPGWAMDAQRVLLQIYDGHLSSTTRATHVPAQETFVTAIGNIPPGVLREQTTLGMLSSGFVGRWLVVPTPAPQRIVSFPMPNGDDPLKRLRSDVFDLMRLATRGERYVVNDLWSERARSFRHEWYAMHRERFADLSPDDPIGVASAELFGRLQATALKVATLLAVSRHGEQLLDLGDLQVDVQDVEWACEVIDASIVYVTETLREGGAETSSVAGQTEGRILRFLEREKAVNRETARTITDIADKTKGRKVSRGDVVRGIDALLQAGKVAVLDAGNRRLVWLV